MTDHPAKSTLKRYGLTEAEFDAILDRQGGVCPICGRVPGRSKKTGRIRWATDHDHVRGWKDMPPEKRKHYVRGITCWVCNRWYLSRGITAEKAANIAKYLIDYANRFVSHIEQEVEHAEQEANHDEPGT